MPGAIDIASAVQTISEKRYHLMYPDYPTRLANARSRFAFNDHSVQAAEDRRTPTSRCAPAFGNSDRAPQTVPVYV